MKQSKWDILLGGLLYCLPFWIMLIPIVVGNFTTSEPINETFILAVTSMMAFWCMGMDLMKIQYLEDEVDKLNKKLDEKE